MNPEMINTYANLFLLLAVVGGVGFAVYRATRKKQVAPRESPKRTETFRPKTREDEEVYEELPIRDWREEPTVRPMHKPVPKAPTFKSVIQKPRASTGSHSPIRRKEVE
jgi:hypothetical protein